MSPIERWAERANSLRQKNAFEPIEHMALECYDALVLAQQRIEKLEKLRKYVALAAQLWQEGTYPVYDEILALLAALETE